LSKNFDGSGIRIGSMMKPWIRIRMKAFADPKHCYSRKLFVLSSQSLISVVSAHLCLHASFCLYRTLFQCFQSGLGSGSAQIGNFKTWFRIHIRFLGIRIQHFIRTTDPEPNLAYVMNTDPYPDYRVYRNAFYEKKNEKIKN